MTRNKVDRGLECRNFAHVCTEKGFVRSAGSQFDEEIGRGLRQHSHCGFGVPYSRMHGDVEHSIGRTVLLGKD